MAQSGRKSIKIEAPVLLTGDGTPSVDGQKLGR
jgi:hypothetical protein